MHTLNNPKVRPGASSTSLYSTYAHHYYLELQSKGFVRAKKNLVNVCEPVDTSEFEYEEGYALAALGEAFPQEVTFARPRLQRKRTVYPDIYDTPAIVEYARSITQREEAAARRAQAEALREIAIMSQAQRALSQSTLKKIQDDRMASLSMSLSSSPSRKN
ncbi:hypothetical protein D9611_003680 [Ephemerocybe angulata]|uniref:Uncharacterized protein n=1 Tax=Ephemerocybe angulata TaxID=980116 RepID=A0A8H5B4Z7_9AGAR|nr:hypothetical protein D9611_003680 [Tulosesus angulatus]